MSYETYPPSLADGPIVAAVQQRILGASGSVFRAFDNMACGFDADEATEFLRGSLHFQSLPVEQQGKVFGLALGFAMVAVESERRLTAMGRRQRVSEGHRVDDCPICQKRICKEAG